ncbi:MAG: low molecular weight phosphatase family protein [SAR116 cluster bacterium]|nr:low molecular weight phosphatase family protein [Paracoccaceae bacterium]RCL78015.1 MAG: low molecular weight phosphatase family protein [SAR116 cluster bacterium]RPH14601.1 MAG: low molecular weight phosphatase family protein [Alphaproteobacteria bacterium TMED150]HCJ61426.1 low molecular weight phosphatase family protein [Alphaproteobacteria bacterium]
MLFCCNMNAVRSPMLYGLARLLYRSHVFLDSCGVHVGQADPLLLEVMDELGVDLSQHKPKNFDDLEVDQFDLVITLTPEAHHRALDLTHFVGLEVEYWPTLDPTLHEGSREQRLQAYRNVRDYLLEKLRRRFPAAAQR